MTLTSRLRNSGGIVINWANPPPPRWHSVCSSAATFSNKDKTFQKPLWSGQHSHFSEPWAWAACSELWSLQPWPAVESALCSLPCVRCFASWFEVCSLDLLSAACPLFTVLQPAGAVCILIWSLDLLVLSTACSVFTVLYLSVPSLQAAFSPAPRSKSCKSLGGRNCGGQF